MRRYADSSKTGREEAGRAAGSPLRSISAHAASTQLARLQALADGGARSAAAGTLQRMADASTRTAAVNRTGLPDRLKAGIESLSGVSMDAVRVHYNSDRPAQLQAHAYAQGTEIHLAPGQEAHLPHEAWHVVQQAQGRVRPTVQLRAGTGINDDQGLEREADAMGARALREQGGAPLQLMARAGAAPVLQLVKYVWSKGKIREVPDDYKKDKKERWKTEAEFLEYHRGDVEELPAVRAIRERIEEEQRAERERLEEAQRQQRKQERAARRARVTPREMPEERLGKQIHYPGVVTRDGREADLSYRGMSVNNIRNLQKGKPSIFTAQNPTGTANAVRHIVDDDPDSPYLSFEAGGLGISAGKYAAKPLDEDNKPLGVHRNEDGFLKQEKSYTDESRRNYPGATRMGYVGGITPDAGSERLDVSTHAKAERELSAPHLGSAEDREQAKKLAKADKEVLVKPGVGGISLAKVPFIARVKEVTKAYYKKHVARQTPYKALGYYKPYDGDPVYGKIQLPADHEHYKFNIPQDLRRTDEDSEDEMSDIESMDLDDYDSDTD